MQVKRHVVYFVTGREDGLHRHIASGPDHLTRFENIATEYGPVDLTFKLSDDGETLEVTFDGDWRRKPQRIVLHTPAELGVSKVTVNGQDYSAEGEIELSP